LLNLLISKIRVQAILTFSHSTKERFFIGSCISKEIDSKNGNVQEITLSLNIQVCGTLHFNGKVVKNLNFCDAKRRQLRSHAERGNDTSKCRLEMKDAD